MEGDGGGGIGRCMCRVEGGEGRKRWAMGWWISMLLGGKDGGLAYYYHDTWLAAVDFW